MFAKNHACFQRFSIFLVSMHVAQIHMKRHLDGVLADDTEEVAEANPEANPEAPPEAPS